MTRKTLLFVILSLTLGILFSQSIVPRELIVKTTEERSLTREGLGLAALDSYLTSRGCQQIRTLGEQASSRFFVITFNEDIDWEEIESLHPEGVEYMQPNYLNEFLLLPDDPYLYEQCMDIVSAPAAWNITTGSRNIIVGVVDSGTHFDHPDLQNNLFINSGEIPAAYFAEIDENTDNRISNPELMAYFSENNYDFDNDGELTHADLVAESSILMNGIDDDGNGYCDDIMGWDFTDAAELANIASGDYLLQDNYPEDEYNHGTHVAGIIGATTDNGIGVSGICWKVNILSIRAGFKTADGLSGVLQDDDASAGIIYAADMGADVINLSWGDYVYSPIIADACEYAFQRGCIVVVSAGNTASEGLMYPAHLAHTISVGSVDGQRERFWQSSYGAQLDLMAPGVNVMSCFDIEEPFYEQMSGTSMSAPYVSGAVALLLSHEPDLDYATIRSRLAQSAVDLGANGFDPYYGNGLLNIAGLLQTDNVPFIEVIYPSDNLGVSSSFAIMGTATAPDFSKYCVMFSNTLQPETTDWRSVENPHSMSANWYLEPVLNGELAWFDIPADDGDFLVKVELVTRTNEHYTYPFTIFIDQSPPALMEDQTAIQYRYEDENLVNYLKLAFDEAVDVEAVLSCVSGDEIQLYSSTRDTLHYLRLPLLIEPGLYSAAITARNVCGLAATFNTEQDLPVKRNCLDYSSWIKQTAGEALVCLDRAFALDDDERNNDLIGMHLADDMTRTISVWEGNGSNLNHRYVLDGFAANFWPHIIGNISGSSFEIVGVEANTSTVYNVEGSYAEKAWFLNNSYGGSFIDYNNDGIDDLGLIQNVTIGSITYRVLSLHKKFGNNWQTQYIIYNNTETYSKNEFLNQVNCADYDTDGKQDILTSDSDGDIIIYEYNNELSTFIQSWTLRLPIQNADYMASGNFTGSETPEFCIGAWNYDEKSAEKTFSWFVFIGSDGTDNGYVVLDTLIFDEYRENIGISSCDLDGDNYEEIILAVDPYIYIVDYIDTDGDLIADAFRPVWRGDSDQHYPKTISAIPAEAGNPGQIIANCLQNEQRQAFCYYPAEVSTGPEPVSGFQASVTGTNGVSLSWLANDSAQSYRIFRKQLEEDDALEVFIAEITELTYIDPEPGQNIIWAYRLRSYNGEYTPSESLPTFWKSVITSNPPQLAEEIMMISPWNLQIVFDQTLANNAVNSGHYNINNGQGRPVSVNMIRQKRGVLLTYHQEISEASDYEIQISGLAAESGIAFPEGNYSFIWQADTFPPQITGSEVISNNRVRIDFSEPVRTDIAENMENYVLELPKVDLDNYLTAVEADGQEVYLTFAHDLCSGNQAYYLRVEKITDLTGNRINNLGNKTYFTLTNSSLENMVTYPNPFYTGKYEEFRFASLPLGQKGEVWIYELTGEQVYHSSISPRSMLENYYAWDGCNNHGKQVSSGLYFYILQIGVELQRGKIAVIN
ncbi:MAG: S8 family serine peptidase [Candidatus Cloacimonetes bacterium]|nr:S8 family serine peptidase [Candidatus Cloacimonadota bacterium]